MQNTKIETTQLILNSLKEKAVVKQEVFKTTFKTFKTIKKVNKYLIGNYKQQLKDTSHKIALDYRDRGTFESEMHVAGDLLFFSMHTNVFTFAHDHWIWKKDYVKNNPLNAYCGIINIYNFLADSFKYNRLDDYGFIIARIFINREGHYFVEGNPNFGSIIDDFGVAPIDMARLREVIQFLILHTIEVDLMTPALKDIQVVTVSQMQDSINQTKMETGKPLGFRLTNQNAID